MENRERYLLSVKRPDLMEKLDEEKNAELEVDVNKLSIGLYETVYWKCEFGHSYPRRVRNQVYLNGRCPKCIGEHTAKNPELLELFDTEKNKNYKKKKLNKN